MASPLLPTMSRGHNALRDALPDLFFAIATLLLGYAMGVVFGLNEDLTKSRLAASVDAVSATVYHRRQYGRERDIEQVVDVHAARSSTRW